MRNRKAYPDNWHDTIRPSILKRDNYRCKICGAKHRSKGYYVGSGDFVECDEFMESWAIKNHISVKKIHLQVAHLDQVPANNEEINLMSLCPKHHLMYDNIFNSFIRKLSINDRSKFDPRAFFHTVFLQTGQVVQITPPKL